MTFVRRDFTLLNDRKNAGERIAHEHHTATLRHLTHWL